DRPARPREGLARGAAARRADADPQRLAPAVRRISCRGRGAAGVPQGLNPTPFVLSLSKHRALAQTSKWKTDLRQAQGERIKRERERIAVNEAEAIVCDVCTTMKYVVRGEKATFHPG